jgi:methyltransferase-like protein 6
MLSQEIPKQRRMAENELSVAAFYCNLFGNEEKEKKTQPYQGESCDPEASSLKEFWVEDTWTEVDEAKAQHLLQSNLEKCSVSTLDRNDEGAGEIWNKFYRDHGTRFFKDRHYLVKAFSSEFAPDHEAQKTLVEIGCGVGNALLPLLEDKHSQWNVIHGLDISHEAVNLLRADSRFVQCNEEDDNRAVYGHVCDISAELPSCCVGIADVTTLLFCLSAINPLAMQQAVRNVVSALKPGGVLVLRDYGRYDEAQMKLGLSRNKLVEENFYRKHDGTKCFYFTLEDIERLFSGVGLETLELKYLRRQYRNNALRETRRRVWVQGRFRKPKSNP